MVLSKHIDAAPADTRLLLQRAELSIQHEDWQGALADCDKVLQIDPTIDAALLRGRTLLASGHPADALPILAGYVGRHPQHVNAWICRARALAQLGRPSEAIADYREALQRSPLPEPDLVLECAAALAAQQNDQAAIQVLDDGLAKLGAIPSLVLRAIDMEIAAGNFDAALARVEAMQRRGPRPEPWMVKRASVLAQAGRLQASRAAWQSLVTHLLALPESARSSHAMNKFMEQAKQALIALDSIHPDNAPPPIPHSES